MTKRESALGATKRLQIEMSAASLEKLKQLKEDSNSPTNAEVCRRALRLYETLLGYDKEGRQIIIRGQDGQDLLFPLSIL